MNNEDVVKLLRQRVEKAGSHQKLALELGVNREDITRALAGSREVSPQLAEALGFEKKTASVFVPKK